MSKTIKFKPICIGTNEARKAAFENQTFEVLKPLQKAADHYKVLTGEDLSSLDKFINDFEGFTIKSIADKHRADFPPISDRKICEQLEKDTMTLCELEKEYKAAKKLAIIQGAEYLIKEGEVKVKVTRLFDVYSENELQNKVLKLIKELYSLHFKLKDTLKFNKLDPTTPTVTDGNLSRYTDNLIYSDNIRHRTGINWQRVLKIDPNKLLKDEA